MTETASKWETRRAETARRLQWCALELTRDRGFDGWTMDDLAEAAEVSRRTVFNYFDAKADVVLGPVHDISEERIAEFVAGGPTGHLFEDLVAVAAEALAEKSTDIDLVQLRRDVFRGDRRLVAIAHDRFESVVQEAVAFILQREGADYGEQRARLLVGLLMVIFESAVERVEPDQSRPFAALINDAVADARVVLQS
ncbi:TetR/AcrR family transcriptional regulator [Nocardioides sp. TF02-7]|uniref:TetR/AcrR family transcriptional regulator n=1 Tax=Nocardioides sp. TF02-7 TaxID=2917724 RepID=UPI001F06224D|nr:TetR/AcrR family transcriptional regulator [Nocardioides sp. TF02-7]UMG94074.1 TetR/AcrR family transcriptional regulator [Nocardioides sp. TF02-7]